MNRKIKISALALSSLLLTSCASSAASSAVSAASYEVKWVSPTGTPALAFYSDAYNSNWVSSSSPATIVAPELKKSDYDAVVFDGISGLNVIKKSDGTSKYRLAEWITGGSFYVVSTKHKANEDFVSSASIESFTEGGIASTVFNKLAKEQWGWEGTINYESGVAGVKAMLAKNPDAYDYYVIAEPAYEDIRNDEALKDKLNIVYSLQEEWEKAGYGKIPGGALFINKDRYDVYKGKIDAFWTRMRVAKDTLINDVSKVVKSLENYYPGDLHDKKLAERFGINGTKALEELQKDGQNRLNFVPSSEIENKKEVANSFVNALGEEAFSDSLFL